MLKNKYGHKKWNVLLFIITTFIADPSMEFKIGTALPKLHVSKSGSQPFTGGQIKVQLCNYAVNLRGLPAKPS